MNPNELTLLDDGTYEHLHLPSITNDLSRQEFKKYKDKFLPVFHGDRPFKGWIASELGRQAVNAILHYSGSNDVQHSLADEWNATTLKSNVKVRTIIRSLDVDTTRECTIATLFKIGLGTKNITSPLQMMEDVDANECAKNEGFALISANVETGYWRVRLDKTVKTNERCTERLNAMPSRPFFNHYGEQTYYFHSATACALYISKQLGRELAYTLAMNFPENTEAEILSSLRAPAMQVQASASPYKCNHCNCDMEIKAGWCAECKRNYSVQQKTTWRGKASCLFRAAKSSTKWRNGEYAKRRGPSRNHCPVDWADITCFRQWMATTLEQQQFRCYYSGVSLSPITVSLERTDEARGYSPQNCVLIDIHFQVGYGQWSQSKVNAVALLRQEPFEFDTTEVDASLHYEATSAKKCYANPPILQRCMRDLKNSCDTSTKERNKRKRDMENNISITDLLNLWKKQHGRCYYLDIPMKRIMVHPAV